MPMLAAIYARQSIEKADSVSIDAQIERCKNVCGLNGWEYQLYRDAGFSGKDTNRPDFERLLRDIEAGTVRAVVSYKLDRISRSITDFARLLEFFEQHSVAYISATEQFDTSSPVGRAMIYIVMVFAQLERETITQRVSDNYRFRAAKGLYMGGNLPLGYRSEPIILDGRRASALVLDPQSAGAVKHIFTLYLGGMNTHQIAQALNAEGILTSLGKTWAAGSVVRVLRNLTYCCDSAELYEYLSQKGYKLSNELTEFDGRHGMCCSLKSSGNTRHNPVAGQVVAVGRHEPILTASEWIAAQNRLEEEKSSPKKPRASSRSWLSGLLKCAECGQSFGLKTTSRGGKRYAYYYCRGRAAKGKGTCPNAVWMNSTALEDAVEDALLRHAADVLKGARIQTLPPDEKPEATEIRQEITGCRIQIENLVNSLGAGNVELDRRLADHAAALEKRCQELQRRLARLETKRPPAIRAAGADTERFRFERDTFSGFDIAEKNAAARSLIAHISITRDGVAQIAWRF